jgi:ankyrin repeat protein
VQLLLEHGGPLNARSEVNGSPLYLASASGHLEVVRLLLTSHGADVHIPSPLNKTPFEGATAGGYHNIAHSCGNMAPNKNERVVDSVETVCVVFARHRLQLDPGALSYIHMPMSHPMLLKVYY